MSFPKMCLITQVFKKQTQERRVAARIWLMSHYIVPLKKKSEISGIMPVKLDMFFFNFQTDEDGDRGYKTSIVMVFGWMCEDHGRE